MRSRHTPTERPPSARARRLANRVEALLAESGHLPPPVTLVSRMLGAPPDAIRAMFDLLVSEGRAIPLEPDLVAHPHTLTALQQAIERRNAAGLPVNPGVLRDELRSTRRVVIPLLERLRASGVYVGPNDDGIQDG